MDYITLLVVVLGSKLRRDFVCLDMGLEERSTERSSELKFGHYDEYEETKK